MTDNNLYKSPDSELVSTSSAEDIATYRKKLIPKWIKVFGWIFIVIGSLAPMIAIFSAMTGVNGEFALYGLETTGSILSPVAMLIVGLFLAHGICAFGLLFTRSWGVSSCMVLGYISAGICVYTMFIGDGLFIRLELAVLIPYIVKLHKLKPIWSGS
ncbi:hypothetical protein KFE80_09660 [bacterium SCSIO 12696]|nr:hypothetical protein KFE80_09660 [bacterium SCSIO 12696]